MGAPAAIGGGASLIGGALGAIGSSQEGRAKARAGQANAAFLRKQAEFTELVNERKVDIFQRESKQFEGQVVSRFAKAGVDMSGTPLMQLAIGEQLANQELQAIKKEGEFQVEILRKQADAQEAAARRAKRSSGFGVFGSILTGVSGASSSGLFGGGK